METYSIYEELKKMSGNDCWNKYVISLATEIGQG